MLKRTLTALLMGACASVVMLPLWNSPSSAGDTAPSVMRWEAKEIEAVGIATTVDADELQLQLGTFSSVSLNLPTTAIDTAAYPLLHLDFGALPADVTTTVMWRNNDSGKFFYHILEVETKKSQWLSLSEAPTWNGQVGTLSIALKAPPHSTIHLRSISLHPPTLSAQLQALASDWIDFSPWGRASMNTNTGVTKLSPFYPVPVVALLLFCSLLAYGALRLITPKKRRIDWRITGFIILGCWLALDLPWQYQLLRQAEKTHNQFAHKSSAEKIAVGPDAALVALTNTAKEKIDSPEARVFVASSDIYTGLRSAYYLYPLNVFWAIRGRELPFLTYLRSGDYILMNRAKTMRINDRDDKLIMSHAHLPIEVLHREKTAALVRLK